MADYVEQQLGNYRLTRLLGQGGFANVYLAEHVYLKTSAAIKILQVRLTREALDTFLAEARTIARLSHPHIVRVLEFGIERDTPFLVMSYAPYGSLRQRHPVGSVLASSQILSYVRQVASALQYAHDRMVIHRDVKPENMLLDEAFSVVLSDFGLATTVQEQNHSLSGLPVHHTGTLAGTTTYMAPEQFDGLPSPASDQYALAVIVYEWLCGTPPFQGSPMGVAVQHMQTPPPSLREKAPSLAPAIEQVVFRALNKDPRQRFPGVWDFARALEEAMTSTSTGNARASLLLKMPPLPSMISDSRPPLWTPDLSLFDHASPTVANHDVLREPASSGPLPPRARPGISSSGASQDWSAQERIARRKMLIGVAGIVGGATILGAGTTWFALASRKNATIALGSTPRVPPTPNAQATARTVIDAINSRPGVATLGTGRLVLFARGGDNTLWRRDYDGAWRNWTSLGGSLAADPVAVSWDGQRIDLFMRGADNTLQHRLYDGTWRAWESLGGSLASDPAVTSWQAGRLDVFARGASDSALWHTWYDGTWNTWESLGGVITAAPAATSWGPNRLDVFARGADNALWHQAWNSSSWSGWQPLGGSFVEAPTAASWGPQRLDVFTRGPDSTLQHIWYDGSNGGSANWQPWQSLGGQLGSAPVAVSWGNNRLDIFARTPGKALQHTWFSGSWQPWATLP